jgi:hypothetical protein
MNTARKQAMAIFAALVKHARDEEMPYTPQNLQKFLKHLKSRPSREVAPGPEGGRAFMYNKPIKLNFPTAKAKQRFLRRGKAPQTMKTTEKKSAWVKRAQNTGRRGAGQRFFEGGRSGAGAGLGLGSLAGALAGGYHGYNMSKAHDNTTDKLKTILLSVLAGTGAGAVAGVGAGSALGSSGGVLFGSRQQQPGPRGISQRFFEGGSSGMGTGLGAGMLAGSLAGGYRGHNMSKGSDVATKLKAILANMLAGAAVGAGVGTAAGGVLGSSGGVLFGGRQQPTF